MRSLILAAPVAIAFASPAAAEIVFSDDFNQEAPGTPASLDNFDTVTGTVDVVSASNNFGIVVSGPASGNVVDLDGTPGPGEIVTRSVFSFNTGDAVTLSLVLGGSQRVNGTDNFFTRLIFGQTSQAFSSASGTGLFSNTGGSGFFAPTLTLNRTIASTSPFATSTFSFVAASPGSVRLAFGSTSSDNVGPLLDNVSLQISAIPEPGTWAMMIAGFGLIGGTMRRRLRKLRPSFA